MSNPIVINPSEVVALSERTCNCGTGVLHGFPHKPLGDCPSERLGASDNQARPLNAREVISMTSEPYKSTGNQARLNNGCVCDSGCDSCDRLAESWKAMREALQSVIKSVSCAYCRSGIYSQRRPDGTASSCCAARAAIRLADHVSGRK